MNVFSLWTPSRSGLENSFVILFFFEESLLLLLLLPILLRFPLVGSGEPVCLLKYSFSFHLFPFFSPVCVCVCVFVLFFFFFEFS